MAKKPRTEPYSWAASYADFALKMWHCIRYLDLKVMANRQFRFFSVVIPAKKTGHVPHLLWQSVLMVGMRCGLYIVGYSHLPEYYASSSRHPREIICT